MSPERNHEAEIRRLERLLGVGRSLTAELNLDAVLDHVLQTARSLTGAQFAAIGVLDERRRALDQFLTSGLPPERHDEIGQLPRGHGVLGVLIDEPRPLRLHDVSEHPRSFGFPAGHPPMRSFLGAPIVIRGEAWGNLYLTEKEEAGDFTEDDVQTIVVLAEWAAIAIDNARLFGESEQRRQELERAVRGFEATVDVALALGESADLDRVLGLIVERARTLVDADQILIGLREGDHLHLAAAASSPSATAGSGNPELFPGSTFAERFRSGEPLRVPDLRLSPLVDAAAFGAPAARHALVVPLVFRGHLLGALAAFGDASREPFGDGDERALRALAASAATAVTSARSVAAQRLRSTIVAAESERRRWARELHDETLQGLGALRLALSAALRAPDPEQQRTTLARAIEQLDQEIGGLRAVIRDLRPAVLDDLGLIPALRTLAERTRERGELRIRTDFELGEDRLAPEIETVAYRVAQEALTNVIKHSRAHEVRLEVAHVPGSLTVRVTDDGVGLGGSTDTAGDGFGLTGMRERAELAGGTIEVRSRPGLTVVELTLPLD